MKNKSIVTEQSTVTTPGNNVSSTKNIQQPTEEQIRYAKLSQLNAKEDNKIPEKIKEVSEITQKPADIVNVALHDSNYDTHLAIQNILEGRYEDHQDEWKTTAKKGKRNTSTPTTPVVNTNHTTDLENKPNEVDIKDKEETPEIKFPSRTSNKSSRGGSNANRGSSNNWRSDNKKSLDFEKPFSRTRENSRERNREFGDRGRGRGRGRGSGRGGRGSGRGGFGRGSYKGSSRSRGGFGHGGFSRGNNADESQNGGGFGLPPSESWNNDDDDRVTGTFKDEEDEWEVEDDVKQVDFDNKNKSINEEEWNTEKDEKNLHHSPPSADGLFTQENSSVNWSQVNGKESVSWADEPILEEENEKFKIMDSAVLRVIPPSSTTGEVTSYQPTNDISHYMNTPSNQFPSSHQAGGLTSSLNEQTFGMANPSVTSANNLPRSIASLQLVSGITESHKLEEEQLGMNKNQRLQQKGFVKKPPPVKTRQDPLQPVVMPRSAELVNDDEEQYSGLEFGSGPLSPRIDKNSGADTMSSSSTNELIGQVISQDILRHSVAPVNMSSSSLLDPLVDTSLGETSLISSSSNDRSLPNSSQTYKDDSAPTTPKNVQPQVHPNNFPTVATKSESIPKTPPGFRPLDQKNNTHYLGSPGRGHLGPDPIPFPSSSNISAPAPSSTSLNVFSRPGGLGTSVTVSEKKTTFADQHLFKHQENINGQHSITEQQRTLADSQYLHEQQQRLLNEQRDREQTIADQKAFAQQKSLAQQKMLAAQRSHQNTTDKSIDQRHTISPKMTSSNLPPPPGVLPPSAYGNSSESTLPSDIPAVTSTPTKSQSSISKSSSGSNQSSGTVPLNLYPGGVQHGMIYQHLHGGYNYEEMAHLHRMQMGAYPYDVSMYTAAPQVAAATGNSREAANMQNYPADGKFTRSSDEQSPVSLPQGNPHVAAAHQQAAYLNAQAGQLQYGYYYQPNMLAAAAQGGVYPTFTTPSVYQVPSKGSQFQSQFQSPSHQQGSSGAPHDFSKTSYHASIGATQQTSQNKSQQNTSSISTSGGINQSVFKSQYNQQDGKGFLGSNPSSIHAQPGVHMQNPAAALSHYLLPQNMMAHGGQVSATHLNQVDTHRGQVHPLANFSGTAQQKRESKGSHHSFWPAGR